MSLPPSRPMLAANQRQAAAGPETTQDRTRVRLRSLLMGDRWVPGDRLPPERSLATELGVSRVTLRGALAGLAREGWVRPRQGSGIQVLDPRTSGGPDMFAWLMEQRMDDPVRALALFKEILRLRRIVALDVLVRASELAQEEDLAVLADLAAAQAERLEDAHAYLDGDEEYQRHLIRLASGEATELMFNSLQRVLIHHRELTLAFMGSLREHHRTYAMVDRLLRSRHPRRSLRLAELALDRVEVRGLVRVRQHLECGGQAGGAGP